MRTKFWGRGEEYKDKNDDNAGIIGGRIFSWVVARFACMCFDKIVSFTRKATNTALLLVHGNVSRESSSGNHLKSKYIVFCSK